MELFFAEHGIKFILIDPLNCIQLSKIQEDGPALPVCIMPPQDKKHIGDGMRCQESSKPVFLAGFHNFLCRLRKRLPLQKIIQEYICLNQYFQHCISPPGNTLVSLYRPAQPHAHVYRPRTYHINLFAFIGPFGGKHHVSLHEDRKAAG